jgi:hypothetical protein
MLACGTAKSGWLPGSFIVTPANFKGGYYGTATLPASLWSVRSLSIGGHVPSDGRPIPCPTATKDNLRISCWTTVAVSTAWLKWRH